MLLNSPILTGVTHTQIALGSVFDPLEGISAESSEGEELTSQINVHGVVNTDTAGVYPLVYQVTDQHGKMTQKKRIVTIQAVDIEMKLEGITPVSLFIGDYFNARQGVVATDQDGTNISHAIRILGHVNVRKAGVYTLTYNVTGFREKTLSMTRKITIQERPNFPPELHGIEPATITVGSLFDTRRGITASDPEEGNLTYAIRVIGSINNRKAGTYTLTYKVSDSKGLTASEQRIITVIEKENTPPEIHGIEPVTLYVGASFDVRRGVTADDIEDGNLTYALRVHGSVNTRKAGKYILTYLVTDRQGVTTTREREITVKSIFED